MNVIVANDRKDALSNLDVEVIKSINGEYDVDELVAMFKDFFFDRMILDITAIKNYNNMVIYEDQNLGTILELSSDDDYFNSFDINVSISKEENFLLKLEETINFDIDADMYKY